MKIIGLLISAFLPVVMLLSSCYYDSEEYLFPQTGNPCDTTNVTYSKSVVPVMQNHCLSCHGNATSALGNSIKLEDYADIKIRADDNSLMGTINHESGYSPMPKNAAKLDNCKIATVRIWVDAGAPNN